MKRKIIIIGLLVLAVAAIAFRLASNKKVIDKQNNTVREEVPIPVNIQTVALSSVDASMVKSGTLIPFKEADISATSSGKLVAVNFELGSYVRQGAVVASIDNEGLRLSLRAAQLNRDKAHKDYKRFEALFQGEAATEVNYLDAKLNYENAGNQIEQIKKQIADNQVKAPISGQVIAKMKEKGEFVSPGAVLGQIVDVSRLKVDVMVSEGEVYNLKKNAAVTVTTDVYPGVEYDGKIIFISESGDATHNYQVEVLLNNKKGNPLKAGSFAYVDFHQEHSEQSILIPKSALIQSLDNPMVYVVENGIAKAKKIVVGKSFDNVVAVASGLNVGEKIVTTGLVNVSDGTKVEIIPEKK